MNKAICFGWRYRFDYEIASPVSTKQTLSTATYCPADITLTKQSGYYREMSGRPTYNVYLEQWFMVFIFTIVKNEILTWPHDWRYHRTRQYVLKQ